jgi:phosphosulfolactate synthase
MGEGVTTDPTEELLSLFGKPRRGKTGEQGQTWISLFGEGPSEVAALMESGGPHIHRAKLAYGSSLLTSWASLVRINGILKEADVISYPGGTLVEMALRAGRFTEFLGWARQAGFTAIEVCDGVIVMSDELRADTIRRAIGAGFRVSTVVQEVIRKPIVEVVPLAERIARVERDLAAGAEYAHIVFQGMARGETPADVVGPIKRDQAFALVERIGPEKLVWEALSADDQLTFVRMLGKHVNLGHVAPRTVVQLAAHRTAFAYETFWSEVWGKPHWS